jgi:hypothetical protein
MKFDFIVRFDSGGPSVSERSKDIARRFSTSRESQEIQNEKTIQDRKILREAFNRMCERFRQFLRAIVEESNLEPEIGDLLDYKSFDNGIEISRKDTGAILSVKFDYFRNTTSLDCRAPTTFKEVVRVCVSTASDTCWYDDGKGGSKGALEAENSAVEYVADRGLNALLGMGEYLETRISMPWR